MRRLTLGVATILLGLVGAGCSLPEVYPLAAGPTGGPSPYGAWYEQHWATNAILLTAAYRQEFGSTLGEAQPEEAAGGETATGEPSDTEAAPRPCCAKLGCPHYEAASSDAQVAEPQEAEAATAPADDADVAPTPIPAASGTSSGKVRY